MSLATVGHKSHEEHRLTERQKTSVVDDCVTTHYSDIKHGATLKVHDPPIRQWVDGYVS